ncbi:hypothetical protein Tco_1411475 [Tanacetum coccineum]
MSGITVLDERVPCISMDKKERHVSLTPGVILRPSSGVRVRNGDAELILALLSGDEVAWETWPLESWDGDILMSACYRPLV